MPKPIPQIRDKEILQGANELDRLAEGLEKEYATWTEDYDISQRPRFPTRAYTAREEEDKRRVRFFWDNAAASGEVLLRLYDAGAFKNEARIRNAIAQMRAEMIKCQREGKAPLYHRGRKRPAFPGSSPWSKEAYEMFLVKMVEGFCKIWAKSYEDRRAFLSYYVPEREKAVLHVKMLRSLSASLKEGCASSSA